MIRGEEIELAGVLSSKLLVWWNLADTLPLGGSAERRGGASPSTSITGISKENPFLAVRHGIRACGGIW